MSQDTFDHADEAESSNAPVRLFISHRHEDKAIADVLQTFISDRSAGAVHVFQSSSPNAAAPEIGKNLRQQLIENLWKTNVVALLYTSPDKDWSYCAWECGIAMHPESPDTKVIVFQCCPHFPAWLADDVRVDLRSVVDIQRFTNEFLTSASFFPRYHRQIAKFAPNGPQVIRAAQELYADLRQVLPADIEDETEGLEWPACPVMTLELSYSDMDRISNAQTAQRLQVAREIIQGESRIACFDKYAPGIFGMQGFSKDMKLHRLIEIWQENHPQSESQWVDAMCCQIMLAAQWQFPRPQWELILGDDNKWYAPVVNYVRKIPQQRCIQFDIYFQKFEVTDDTVKISPPRP